MSNVQDDTNILSGVLVDRLASLAGWLAGCLLTSWVIAGPCLTTKMTKYSLSGPRLTSLTGGLAAGLGTLDHCLDIGGIWDTHAQEILQLGPPGSWISLLGGGVDHFWDRPK